MWPKQAFKIFEHDNNMQTEYIILCIQYSWLGRHLRLHRTWFFNIADTICSLYFCSVLAVICSGVQVEFADYIKVFY